ncbi:MAG TPA: ABC transporter substrate-binding protein [Candidatus Sulfotelmatobacter sp.]|nr:ABC transporter substrate-binding protein [Candidatus Sulfotelmatobacter sp.]
MMLRITGGIAALAVCLLAAPPEAGAGQPAKVWRIGLFHVGLDHVPPSLDGLREGLKALGYEEGKNIRLDWRNLPDEEAARATARDFVQERVDLIVAFESQTIRAAKAATTEIPVVFLHPNDPVAEGFVRSFSHSGGNLTGTMDLTFELEAKRIELFKEMVPRLRRLLVLIDPEDPDPRSRLAEVRKAGTVLKLRLVEREATTQADIERVFASVKRGEAQGVFAVSSTLASKYSSLILRLATERRLPVAIHRKEWVERGALFSYGPDFRATGRTAARYVDKILKGAKPADLPVEQATRFELVINLRTAKALGLTIPQSVLMRADQVIQ